MASRKERILVVCPGRGSYTKDTLGYLHKYRPILNDFFALIDSERQREDYPTITELDSAEHFKVPLHTKGEHASVLIYACAAADFMSIAKDRFEIAAVMGNSMGWYIACALAGALSPKNAFRVIHTMGAMMKDGVVGGQIIYPVVNSAWQIDPQKQKMIQDVCDLVRQKPGCLVYDSIYLGGYLVIGGNAEALRILLKELPKEEDYPFQLINHAAFHTPLLDGVSQKAFAEMGPELFTAPEVPLIDGRGKVWQSHSTNIQALYDYTLGHQVVKPYDFTRSLVVGLKEFAPDRVVLLGPGNSLGGAIGQTMISIGWKGLSNKADFQALQKTDKPFLLSMGLAEQARVLRA